MDKFKKLNVFVLGELIVDKYCFGNVIGKSGKEPFGFKENKTEYYLGGSAAVVKHIASFVNKTDILSPFGFEKYYNKIIDQEFPKNINKNFLNLIKITEQLQKLGLLIIYQVINCLAHTFYLKNQN